MTESHPLQAPFLGPQFPVYPHLMQALRVTGGTVPGPSGYASSSALGPSLYVGFVQQLVPSTVLPRDREPCLVLDLNRVGLSPGYYDGRLVTNYQSLPVYAVGGASNSPLSAAMLAPPSNPAGTAGLTPAQVISLQSLVPTQLAVLNNLTPCQLVTLVNALPLSQIQSLTLTLTPSQLGNLITLSTPAQLTSLYSQLTTSQVITLTTSLNQEQTWNLITVLTPQQIQTLVTNLTTTQLQTIASLPPYQISELVTNLTTTDLITFLSISKTPTYSNSVVPAYSTTVTTGGTTTLTSISAQQQYFTGTLTQTVKMPDVATLIPGLPYRIVNKSSGALTIQSIGGNSIGTVAAGGSAALTSIATSGSTAAAWDMQTTSGGSGTVTSGVAAASSFSSNSTSYTDMTGMSFVTLADGTYEFTARVYASVIAGSVGQTFSAKLTDGTTTIDEADPVATAQVSGVVSDGNVTLVGTYVATGSPTVKVQVKTSAGTPTYKGRMTYLKIA